MNSISNLPLLDIAEEDDSLLFDVSTSSTTTNLLSCSPLIPLRSVPSSSDGRYSGTVDSESASFSLNENTNKENADLNKPQKLSVEPLQMKKKKKRGGGYNLRKSLAWDKAFFTEQGVLNPAELSVISGGAKAGLNLEAIEEEESIGTSTTALQEIEEDLFVHSSDVVSVKDRKIGLSPKPSALAKASPAPVSLAKRKVLTVNDTVGNRAKRNACPRLPPASSSLKRPDTVKAPSKELKVSRIPGPKLVASSSSSAARSGMLTTGPSKRNQNAHSATNLQKNAGVKSLSKNPKTVTSNPKVGPADKCTVTRTLAKRAGKHLDNPVSETRPSSRMHQSGTEANNVSEACFPQVVYDIGEKRQQTHVQTTKLSGLRMPSPSLGFFSHSQAKAQTQLQKSSKPAKPAKPAKSNIPTKLQDLETNSVNEVRLPLASGIRSEIVKGAAKNCTGELSLLDLKSEPNKQLDNEQMADVEVAHDSMVSEKMTKHEKTENILEHANIKAKKQGELHRSESASSMEDMIFPIPEKKLLSKIHTQEQLEKKADHPDVLSNGYQSVFQEPQSVHYHGIQRTSMVKGSISNTVHNAMEQHQDEHIKLLACDVLTSNESLVLQAKHDTSFKDSRFSGEFKENNSVKAALINSSLHDFSETVLGGSIPEQENGAAADFVTSGEDAQMHVLDRNLSVDCNEITVSNLEAVNQQLQRGELKTTRASIAGEYSSIKENESHVNNCQLVNMTTLSSKGSPQMSIPEIKCSAESKPIIAEIEDCQFPLDDQPGFIQTSPVFEGCEKVIDSKAMHDSTQASELERSSNEHIAVSATACNTEVSNVSQESRPFHENKLIEEGSSQDASMLYDVQCDIPADTQVVKLDQLSEDCTAVSATACTTELIEEGSSCDASVHYDVPCDIPEDTPVIKLDTLSEDCTAVSPTTCTTELIEGSSRDASTHYDVQCDIPEDTLVVKLDTLSEDCTVVSPTACTTELIEEGCSRDASMQYDVPCDIPEDTPVVKLSEDRTAVSATACATEIIEESSSRDASMQYDVPCDIPEDTPVVKLSADCTAVSATACTTELIEESSSRDASMHYDVPCDIPEDTPVVKLSEDCTAVSATACTTELIEEGSSQDASMYYDVPCDIPEDTQVVKLDQLSEDCTVVFAIACTTELIEEGSSCDASVHYDVPCDIPEDTPVVKLDTLSEDCTAVSPTTCTTEIRDEGSSRDTSMQYGVVCDVHEATQGFELDKLSEECIDVSATACNTELQVRDESSSRDTSMHYSFPCDIPGDLENQTSNITYCKANEMLCEDDSLVLNHGLLLDQSEFFEVSAGIISDTKDSIGSGAENSSDYLQQTLLPQLVQEVDHTNREIEESHVEEDSPGEAAMHYDFPCNVPGKFEQQTIKITNSKANEMPREDESLALNHDGLLSQSEFSEVSAGIISNTEGSMGIGAGKCSDFLQQALSARLLPEVDHTNREIAEPHVEDVQVQSSSEDPVPFNCNNSENVDNTLHLDGDCLPTNIASSEEFKKTNLSDGALEGCNIHTGEPNACSHHIQAMPVSEDGNRYADEREELLLMDDAKNGSSNILTLVEVQLNDRVVSSESNSSLEVNKSSLTDVGSWKSEDHCSLSESSNIPVPDNPTCNTQIPQVCEVSSLNMTSSPDETDTNIVEKDEFPNSDLQHKSEGDIYSAEDNSKINDMQNSAAKSDQEVPTVKPPPNAAPFSDEWLAAIEAAGEEILAMKSGAVQNSPPEKPQQEPGPWSPVKRKNQSIGPFDCTKHNIQHPSSE